MRQLIQRILFPQPAGSSFLILEALPQEVRAFTARIAFGDGRAAFARSRVEAWTQGDEEGMRASLARVVRGVAAPRAAPIVVAADSRFATTTHTTVSMQRRRPNDPITEVELDNCIAQSLWKIFDRERTRAARKMEVSDLDVVLSEVSVPSLLIDGRETADPLGRSAATLHITFRQTFLPRTFDALVRGALGPRGEHTVIERGISVAALLARRGAGTPLALIEVLEDRTHVMLAHAGEVAHLTTIPWGKNDLIERFSGTFSVTDAVGEQLLGAVLVRQASARFLKHGTTLIGRELSRLTGALAGALKRHEVRRGYAHATFQLPEHLFSPRVASSVRSRFSLQPLGDELIGEVLGVTVTGTTPWVFVPLATALDLHFSRRDDTMNRIAKRQARWLTR